MQKGQNRWQIRGTFSLENHTPLQVCLKMKHRPPSHILNLKQVKCHRPVIYL